MMVSSEDRRIVRAFDVLIITLIATLFAIVLGLAAVVGFVVRWETFMTPAAVAVLCFIGSVIYGTVRRDDRLSSAMMGAAQFIVFTLVGAPLSYIAASAAMPYQDAAYAAFDAAIGFDWVAMLRLMDRWSAFQLLFSLPYLSMLPQIAALTLLLSFQDKHLDLRRFLFAFAVAAIVTIAVSAAVPAIGPWNHYGVDQLGIALQPAATTAHVPLVEGLRDGSIRELVGVGAVGLIAMPSLHAASAVLLILSAWTIPGARWFFLLLNLVMLFATVIEGLHYLCDLFAGIALGLFAHAAARAVAALLARPAPVAAVLGARAA